MTNRLAKYWHTLRHLRPVQFYGRLWFRLYKPVPDLTMAPALRDPSGPWLPAAPREPSLYESAAFEFLGERGRLNDVGWEGPQREKLWRYNQHYFDDLNARDAEKRKGWHAALLADWVLNCAPGKGDAWEPYPTSLRIVNWVKWALAGNTLPAPCVQSLAVQSRWLRQRLEVHLLGNHLFANAKALVFSGLFFEGPEAQGWLTAGLDILDREMREQILPDGGHFERSTMYHVLALEDILDLCNVMACYEKGLSDEQREVGLRWRDRAVEMQGWMNSMRHPDGEIGFFNDAAFGIAPACDEINAYVGRLGLAGDSADEESSYWLKSSGYARLAVPHAVALLDMAPVGPDYLPGHAHADTLSFELSVHGQRLFVNSGTSCYGRSDERLRQRGTAAHNTVVINGVDSSEVWGGFRVARRARPISPATSFNSGELTASCSHDGYTRLPGRPVHSRYWRMTANGLRIDDEVRGAHRVAEARYHFHPGVVLKPSAEFDSGMVVLPEGQTVVWKVANGRARIEPATWHPRFGKVEPSHCLVLGLVDGRASLQLSWLN